MTTSLDTWFRPDERVGLFIDGANHYAAAKALGLEMDYRRLLDEVRKRCKFIRAYYYTALMDSDEFNPIRRLVDWLDYNGFTVITKPAREMTDSQGRRRIKGDMDVEIAVDAMQYASFLDHVVLFSGDGDFFALVEALQRRGVRVTAISTIKSQPPMASDDLRRQVDQFIDLADIGDQVGRPMRARAPDDY
jgi:uncharacterized LabA/DUF88 family protein